MTGHSALPDAGKYAGSYTGRYAGEYAAGEDGGPCGPSSFAAGPAPGAGIARPAGLPRGAARVEHSFACKIVDNLLNNTVNVQADLVPTNT
jgi:hypothetical protein